jgi:hypothetical protein
MTDGHVRPSCISRRAAALPSHDATHVPHHIHPTPHTRRTHSQVRSDAVAYAAWSALSRQAAEVLFGSDDEEGGRWSPSALSYSLGSHVSGFFEDLDAGMEAEVCRRGARAAAPHGRFYFLRPRDAQGCPCPLLGRARWSGAGSGDDGCWLLRGIQGSGCARGCENSC